MDKYFYGNHARSFISFFRSDFVSNGPVFEPYSSKVSRFLIDLVSRPIFSSINDTDNLLFGIITGPLTVLLCFSSNSQACISLSHSGGIPNIFLVLFIGLLPFVYMEYKQRKS